MDVPVSAASSVTGQRKEVRTGKRGGERGWEGSVNGDPKLVPRFVPSRQSLAQKTHNPVAKQASAPGNS